MKKRLLSIVLALALCLGLLPAVSLTASAADTGKAIQLGTGGISGYSSTNGYDYIYYGTWDSSAIKWRVLDDQTNTGASGLFLLSEALLDKVKFGSNKNWQGSDAQAWCKDFAGEEGAAANVPNAFTADELSAILATTKSDDWCLIYEEGDTSIKFAASNGILNGDRVFFLSGEEAANAAYGFNSNGYTGDAARKATYNGEAASWWLRSPTSRAITYYVGWVDQDGLVSLMSIAYAWATRPAFNLNTDKVLFTSAATNSGHNSSFAAPATYTGNEWKVTLKDSSNFADGASVSGTTTVVEGYAATELTITHKALSEISTAYTNVTAMLTDENGDLLYYGSINDDPSATSSTVTIPAGLVAGEYTLSVYGEDWNEAKRTDYATGTPFTTTITVHKHSWNTSIWEHDVTGHWHPCTTGCPVTENGEKDGYAAHSADTTTGNCVCGFNPLTVTVCQSPASYTYGDAGVTLSAAVTRSDNGSTEVAAYAWSDGSSTDQTITLTGLNAGDHSYTCTITTADGYEKTSEVFTVSVGKAASSVTTPPTAATGPTYTGQPQALLTAGGTANGGTMQYSLEENGTYSTDFPQGTDANTYTVYYKVVGDANHNDSAPAYIETKIEKASLDVKANDHLLTVNSPVPDLTYTITGFVNSETIDVISGTPALFFFGETPDMSQEGFYLIEVNTDGMSAANYDLNAISGELQVVTCVHDFTEFSVSTSADGTASILAKCSNNCAEFAQPAAIITITAPDNAVYEQGLDHNVSLMHDSQVQVDSEDIVYSGDPVDAGTYTASITYGGKTASVTYTIAQRLLTIKADNKSVYVGESESAYSYTVTGWDNGHDDEDPYSDQLSGVTAVCGEADLTKTGTYEITLSGIPVVKDFEGNDVSYNYDFTMENGTLTVRTRPSSGGESTPTYSPTIEDNAGGNTTVSNKNPECGDKVTITTEPNEGYQVGEVIVTDRNGNEVEVTDNDDGTYSFKQPSGKVNIEVTYVLKQYFTDVSENAYYFDAVLWALDEGITSGTSATTFSPDAACTRAQMATFLWRAAGSPAPKGNSNPFTDVSADAYYAEAVQWAVEQGITVGTSATTFSPDANCTRAQMAVFIYRNEQAKGGGFTGAWMFRLPFTDTPEWAYEAIAWCYKEGITEGTGATTFSPDAPCTRAQMVTFLYRFFVK